MKLVTIEATWDVLVVVGIGIWLALGFIGGILRACFLLWKDPSRAQREDLLYDVKMVFSGPLTLVKIIAEVRRYFL